MCSLQGFLYGRRWSGYYNSIVNLKKNICSVYALYFCPLLLLEMVSISASLTKFRSQIINGTQLDLYQLGPSCKDLKTKFARTWTHHRGLQLHTCQNMKCSLMMVFTASLLQTSLFRHWQAKSWTFWMLIISHLFSSCPQSLAWKHTCWQLVSDAIVKLASLDEEQKVTLQLDGEQMKNSIKYTQVSLRRTILHLH